MLEYGEHNISALKLQGHVEEQAIAETLADSPFNGHIELYFKLVGRSVDKEYIDDIKERILALKNKDETLIQKKSALNKKLVSWNKKLQNLIYKLQIL